jgi:hypothetical protein
LKLDQGTSYAKPEDALSNAVNSVVFHDRAECPGAPESRRILMPVFRSDDSDLTVLNSADQSKASSVSVGGLIGMVFATLAGVAMVGWLYLITKIVWASIDWFMS